MWWPQELTTNWLVAHLVTIYWLITPVVIYHIINISKNVGDLPLVCYIILWAATIIFHAEWMRLGQCHVCWCPVGDLRCQVRSRYIYPVSETVSCLPWMWISITHAIWFSGNDIQHKYLLKKINCLYSDVTVSGMASQITGISTVCSMVCSYQRKHKNSASLALVSGIHRWPVYSTHKRPVTLKMFPFDDVIMVLTMMQHVNRWYYAGCRNPHWRRQESVYHGLPIPWYLMMTWRRMEPSHQQVWYWHSLP